MEAVAEFYSKGAGLNPNLDREIRPLNLTVEEQTDLVAFLKSLTGAVWTLGHLGDRKVTQ